MTGSVYRTGVKGGMGSESQEPVSESESNESRNRGNGEVKSVYCFGVGHGYVD